MDKTLIINESQYKKLFTEAMKEGFMVDVLRGKPFNLKFRYLKQYFGNPIGKGSSRWVYQIDDYAVLKVAVNEKGVAQNESEYNLLKSNKLNITPKLLNGSDDTNFEWIVTEYVLPAKVGDFRKIIGVPFKTVSEFCGNCDLSLFAHSSIAYKEMCDVFDKYENNDEATEFFSEIQTYGADYCKSPGDLRFLCNWGLANREYGPQLVVLDAGLTEDIYKKYYAK